jgi:fructokinase
MIHYLLQGADLPKLNEAGNRWGGWVASQAGAMPPLDDLIQTRIAESIEA